eukprot:6740147-Prymnesium_polylepis.1
MPIALSTLSRPCQHRANSPAVVGRAPSHRHLAADEQRRLPRSAVKQALVRPYHRHVPIRQAIKQMAWE